MHHFGIDVLSASSDLLEVTAQGHYHHVWEHHSLDVLPQHLDYIDWYDGLPACAFIVGQESRLSHLACENPCSTVCEDREPEFPL